MVTPEKHHDGNSWDGLFLKYCLVFVSLGSCPLFLLLLLLLILRFFFFFVFRRCCCTRYSKLLLLLILLQWDISLVCEKYILSPFFFMVYCRVAGLAYCLPLLPLIHLDYSAKSYGLVYRLTERMMYYSLYSCFYFPFCQTTNTRPYHSCLVFAAALARFLKLRLMVDVSTLAKKRWSGWD